MRLLRFSAALMLFTQDPVAPPRFEAFPGELRLGTPSLTNAIADYDGDGDLDVYVGMNGAPNRLYRNDGASFSEVAGAAGVADARATRSAAWGDSDADGDPDLLLGFAPGPASILKLYRNDTGRFTDITRESGLQRDSAAVRQLSWIDLDADGDLDLFVAFRDKPNAFYRNEGGRFTDVAASLGLADARKSVGAVWLDYDQDGDLDLYLANQDGDRNGLWRNDGARFTDVADSAGVAWGGRRPDDPGNGTVRPCAADVDGDGRLDLFAANYGKNGLLLNRGGRFEDVSAAWGIDLDARSDACAFGDVDHDGRLDLYVNGTVTGGVSYRDFLYRHAGSRYADVTPDSLAALQADHGVQWADLDGDGDLDLALTGAAAPGTVALLRNQLPPEAAARSLSIRVLDARGRATRAGAEVHLFAAGTRRRLGTRLVDTGSGYNAQNEMPVHFGLADLASVDVEVVWPENGRRIMKRVANLRPADWAGKSLVVRVGK
jgi:VCBS repeat protein/ASPIC/UnbV protein